MAEIVHHSIGERGRLSEVSKEEKAEARKEIMKRYLETPVRGYRLDQLSLWMLWATVATSIFLFCTVSVVRFALR